MPSNEFETTVIFGDTPRRYKLKQAILIYKDDRLDCAASIHAVTDGQRPTLLPGQPATVAALDVLLGALGRRVGGGFIAPEILSIGLDSLVWWCPSARRRIWFKPNTMFDDSKDEDTKRLIKINGQFIWYPPLLFTARTDVLSVFALAINERPQPDTRLWKAPFWNLSDGGMCNGNLKLPAAAAENITRFEQAFFDSAFTHNSQGGMLTRHPKGYCRFLENLARRKTKPETAYWVNYLISTQQQVKSVVGSRESNVTTI
jgi:PRTRC genetic system protein B